MDAMTTSRWLLGNDVSPSKIGESRLDEDSPDDELSTSDLLWIYVAPCILITGVCGNTLVLLVMSQGRMRGTSTSVYLLTMAVADLFAIITGVIPDWLTAMGTTTIKEIHPFLCKTEKFLSYTSADTSIWACVAFTIDRFVAVCFPMDSAQLCPPQNAKFYASAVFLAAICKNLHVFATRGQLLETVNNVTTVKSNCKSPNEAYAHFEEHVRPWIAFTVVNLLPFIIIVFCNLFIVRSMIRLRRSQRQSAIISSKDSATTIQMTVLCLNASICFLVCVTPSMILLIGRPHWANQPEYLVAKAAGNLIFYVNHSINFFLYCVTGAKFRAELRALFSRTDRTGPRSSIYRNSTDPNFKQRTDRLSELNGHYWSAPCISKPVGERATPQPTEWNQGDSKSSNVCERIKASSDAVLLGSSGV